MVMRRKTKAAAAAAAAAVEEDMRTPEMSADSRRASEYVVVEAAAAAAAAVSRSPSSEALVHLAAETRQKLEAASRAEQDAERDKLLARLFGDLIGTIDDDVKAFLDTRINEARHADADSDANAQAASSGRRHEERRRGGVYGGEFERDATVYFYEVLAMHFSLDSEMDASVLKSQVVPVFRRCIGSPSLPSILALLLHVRLLDSPTSFKDRYDFLWCVNLLLEGAQALMWMDLNSRSQRFRALHQKFFRAKRDRLSLGRTRAERLLREQIDTIFWSFSVYYYCDDDFVRLLEREPAAIVPCLRALANQLRAINVEEVLVDCLRVCMALAKVKDWNRRAGPLVSLRFQRSIYLLSQPGGPYYPPPSVRKAAFKCLNVLYPVRTRNNDHSSPSSVSGSLSMSLLHSGTFPD